MALLEEIKKSSAATDFLSFPASLKSYEGEGAQINDCLHFSCVDAITKSTNSALATNYRQAHLKATSANTKIGSKITEDTLVDIYMYKPQLQTKLSHKYDGVEAGILDNMMAAWKTNSDASNANKAGNIGSDGESPDKGDNFMQVGAKSMVGLFGSMFSKMGATSEAMAKGRTLITPIPQMYKGTENRVQTFNFRMNPRNKQDLQQMAQIIYNFHLYSLSTLGATGGASDRDQYEQFGTAYYQNPKMWYVREMFGVKRHAVGKGGKVKPDSTRHTPRFVFGPAAITNIEYNMTADEFAKTFQGTEGDPVSVDLTITMTELVPMDSQMYQAQQKYTNLETE